MTVREKLYGLLESRPAGAPAIELASALFSGRGSDPELGQRVIEGLLGGDPNFLYDRDCGHWSLKSNSHLRAALSQARFVVVDLETVGGRPGPGTIIEIGAYEMRGPRIGGSFEALVRPRTAIPRFITRLTSISNEMVAQAAPIDDVLPAFREFLGDAVMVAHNAQFDFAFLDFEFRRLFRIGLLNPVLCTIRLARRLWPSLRRRRLDLLAEHFGLSTAGRHRGLGDARMAAELFSIQLESAERMGLKRLDRLLEYQHAGAAGRRIERHVAPELIAAIPERAGVYLMRNQRGELLYVGKARSLKARVASYFNGGMGLKPKTIELVNHVWLIETIVTRSSLEAALLEARLIREHKPPYNKLLKSARPAFFVKLDMADRFPRFRVSTRLSARRGLLYLGPFIGRPSLEHAVRVISRLLGLRVCGGTLKPAADFSPCIYGQMGHCLAPCNLSADEERYAGQVLRAIEFVRGRSTRLIGLLAAARDQGAAAMRFEEAQRYQRDLEALRLLSIRERRLSQAIAENNLVIVTGDGDGRTAHVVLGGRLGLSVELDSAEAGSRVTAFVRENFDRYRTAPVRRDELEAMAIVARWLRERDPGEGRLTYLSGPVLAAEELMGCPLGGSIWFEARSE